MNNVKCENSDLFEQQFSEQIHRSSDYIENDNALLDIHTLLEQIRKKCIARCLLDDICNRCFFPEVQLIHPRVQYNIIST